MFVNRISVFHKIISSIIVMLILSSYSLATLADLTGQVLPDKSPDQTPDLMWQPEPFEFITSQNIRYIDFESGNDNSDGSLRYPWKHHPWDTNAGGKVANAKGIKTYVFKKGVTYRGQLTAAESGTRQAPITLTIDPGWGKGEAVLAGSVAMIGGWDICSEIESKILPEKSRDVTWCQDIDSKQSPRHLWEIKNNESQRVPLARMPNWNISVAQDPRSEWSELISAIAIVELFFSDTHHFKVGDIIQSVAPVNKKFGGETRKGYKVVSVSSVSVKIEVPNWVSGKLRKGMKVTNNSSEVIIKKVSTAHETSWRLNVKFDSTINSSSQLKGANIWVERAKMPKPIASAIDDINIEDGIIRANLHVSAGSGPVAFSRYYLEGAAGFLDDAAEFHFERTSKTGGRLYLRLADDRNPNETVIELANVENILEINNKNNILVSGLSFRFSNQIKPGTRKARNAALHASAIQIRGTVDGVQIDHCHFENLAAGIIVYPLENGKTNTLDDIVIVDNVFVDIDGEAISIGNGRDRSWARSKSSRLLHVTVKRNKLDRVGLHALGHWSQGSHGHGIHINGAEIIDVSGNHVNHVGGSGILVFTGSAYKEGGVDRPFLRTFISGNKVTNSLLRVQDYGGISSWMGGPSYIYNNISANPVGYKHIERLTDRKTPKYRRGAYGIGIYLDGQYKSYVFNNIVWGRSNNVNDRFYNSVAFNEAMGFMNTVFNNTFYNFVIGIHKGMFQHNRSYYIGNLFLDMGEHFIKHETANEAIDYETIAYHRNVFSGTPLKFGQLGRGRGHSFSDIEDWIYNLRNLDALDGQTGLITKDELIKDKVMLDFRPDLNSVAIDYARKIFVPWPLYRVVGEWNFFQNSKKPAVVHGESINMNSEWLDRSMFDDIPRNDLSCSGVTSKDYRDGVLEGWTKGALRLNGRDSFCYMRNSDLSKGYRWKNRQSKKIGYILGADRDTVDIDNENFLIEVVLSLDPSERVEPILNKVDGQGYVMDITVDGEVRLSLISEEATVRKMSAVSVDDGKWHHIIVEVSRNNSGDINIYVDGVLSNGRTSRNGDLSTSLSNSADFYIGRDNKHYFSGALDYLRISKGTLKDAETSIEELYNWQFSGPFLNDFSGLPLQGINRDAGAVEFIQ